jgi:hypothetical protein
MKSLVMLLAIFLVGCTIGPLPVSGPDEVCDYYELPPGCSEGQYYLDYSKWYVWDLDCQCYVVFMSCPYWYCQPPEGWGP